MKMERLWFVISNALTILILAQLTGETVAQNGSPSADASSDASVNAASHYLRYAAANPDQSPTEHRSSEACGRDSCGGDDDDDDDEDDDNWSALDANDDARDIISRLSSYETLCNVERRNLDDLSFSEFLHRYAYNEPVILRGASDNCKLRELTKRRRLVGNYGKSVVRLSTANTHSYDKVDTTLSNYVNRMMKPQSLRVKGNETFYWFGDNNYTEFASLFAAYNPPKYLLPDTMPAYSFGVAGTGTGVPFHWHGPGFAEVIHGKKMWFLSPPDLQPNFHPDMTTLHWLLNEYDHIAEADVKPSICTIQPGEAIYFPDRWWHATLNTRTSVFISTFLAKL